MPRSVQRRELGEAAVHLILPAGAQQAPQGTPTRIRGTVEKLDGQALTVKSREGEIVTIALADNVAVAYLVKKNVGDIKPGDYIASTGIKGTDGKLHAIEVRIFPESLRGAGEGQYPWDLKPDSVMTNATVGTITQAPPRCYPKRQENSVSRIGFREIHTSGPYEAQRRAVGSSAHNIGIELLTQWSSAGSPRRSCRVRSPSSASATSPAWRAGRYPQPGMPKCGTL